MKLDYSILWIEDELHSIQETRDSITDYLKSHHFIPEIKFVTTKEEADDIITSVVKPYDLVVSDLNLDDHHNSEGITLISELRDNQYFGDIILYSSSSLKDVLDKMIGELESTHPLIGVHMVEGRDNELSGMIEDFINFFIEKNLTIESARGFILAEVSYIDAETNQYLLNELLNANPTNNLERIIVRTLHSSVINGTRNRLNQKNITGQNVTTILDAFKVSAAHHLGVVTSTNLCKILSEYLTLGSCSYSNSSTGPGPYESLIYIRNDFAHKTNAALRAEHVDLRGLTNRMREQFILHREQLKAKGVL